MRPLSFAICAIAIVLLHGIAGASVPDGTHTPDNGYNPHQFTNPDTGETYRSTVSITKLPDGSITIITIYEKRVNEDPEEWEKFETRRVDAHGNSLRVFINDEKVAELNGVNVHEWLEGELGKAFDDEGEFTTYPEDAFDRWSDEVLQGMIQNGVVGGIYASDWAKIPGTDIDFRMVYQLRENEQGQKYVVARPYIRVNGQEFPVGPFAVVATEAI